MTYFGQVDPIAIYNSQVDPITRRECICTDDGPDSCVKTSANMICDRIHLSLSNYVSEVKIYIASELQTLLMNRHITSLWCSVTVEAHAAMGTFNKVKIPIDGEWVNLMYVHSKFSIYTPELTIFLHMYSLFLSSIVC
jgi:hypothetical protein